MFGFTVGERLNLDRCLSRLHPDDREQVRHAVARSLREGADYERATEVIRRMRALLRKRELEREPLEINSLVEDVFYLVSSEAALRKTGLSGELSPALPPIQGDRIHLQQVFLNLIPNGMGGKGATFRFTVPV